MSIDNPTEYIKPCKNNGQCGNIRIRELIPNYSGKTDFSATVGRNYVAFGSTEAERNRLENQVRFKCCNSCHQPIDLNEAIRLNNEIGFELPTIKDTLSKLKAMKERLKQNEGRTR